MVLRYCKVVVGEFTTLLGEEQTIAFRYQVCQVVQGFSAHSCLPFSFSADRLVQFPICFCEFVVGVLIGSLGEEQTSDTL